MPPVSSMTTPLRAYVLRIDSSVIPVLAINSSKIKQIDLMCFAVVELLSVELTSKYH